MNSNQNKTFFETKGGIPENFKFNQFDKLYLQSGPYLCKQNLGEGGFGQVYHIENENDHNEYAMKILDLAAKDPREFDNYKRRFLQGFDIGTLKSGNLVTNYYSGEILGNPYILMEYCNKGNLRSRIGKDFSKEEIDKLGRSILEGLITLHKNGIVHRDLKPENILFDHNNDPKLSDYDISIMINQRQTLTNWLGHLKQVWGTLPYAPPEQLDPTKGFKALTFASDIFSFGITMYETITKGCLPYGSYEEVKNNPEKYYERISKDEFIPVDKYNRNIYPYWIRIIHKCISSHSSDRYSNAMEVYYDLPKEQSEVIITKDHPVIEGVWSFVILNGSERGKVYNLNELLNLKMTNQLSIGYAENRNNRTNDINVNEYYTRYISRKQATLIFDQGIWSIRDGQFDDSGPEPCWKPSKNGTYVNSNELELDQVLFLNDGDIIQIGDDTSIQLQLK